MRSTVILFIICLLTFRSFGQKEVKPFVNYDSLTYAEYSVGYWNSLVKHSREAIQEGAGTIAIRKRLGYGYFKTGNYFQSAQVYRTILCQNENDVDARLMLYSCAMETGRDAESRFYAGAFTETEKSYYRIPKFKWIESADLTSGTSFNNNLKKNGALNIRDSQEYGVQQLDKSLYFISAGLNLAFGNRFHVYVAYTGLQMERENRVAYTYPLFVRTISDQLHGAPYLINEYLYGDTLASSKDYINQHQFYLDVSVYNKSLGTVSVFGQFVPVQYRVLHLSSDTLWFPVRTWDGFGFSEIVLSKEESKSVRGDYLAGASVEKQVREFKASVSGVYSQLNDHKQFQSQVGLVWYPFGNTKLSFTTQLTGIYRQSETRYLPFLEVAFQVKKVGWVSSNFLLGNFEGMSERNGSIVYNQVDKSKYRAGVALYHPLNKNLSINFEYRFSSMESRYSTVGADLTTRTTFTPYNQQLISLGFKIKL